MKAARLPLRPAFAKTCYGSNKTEEVRVKEIAPTGKLRVGVVYAPVATAFFVTKDAEGKPHGVTVDLANELAA